LGGKKTEKGCGVGGRKTEKDGGLGGGRYGKRLKIWLKGYLCNKKVLHTNIILF